MDQKEQTPMSTERQADRSRAAPLSETRPSEDKQRGELSYEDQMAIAVQRALAMALQAGLPVSCRVMLPRCDLASSYVLRGVIIV